MEQTPETIGPLVARLQATEAAAGRESRLEVTAAPRQITVIGDAPAADDIAHFEAAGVDRLIVSPWRRTSEAIEGLERFAKECDLEREHIAPVFGSDDAEEGPRAFAEKRPAVWTGR